MDTKNLPQAKIDEDNLGITAFLNKEAVKQQVAQAVGENSMRFVDRKSVV